MKLTEEQEKFLEDLDDDVIEQEACDRGLIFREEDCDDCPDCDCDEFEDECREVWQLFYQGKDQQAIEAAKSLVCEVTGRYL